MRTTTEHLPPNIPTPRGPPAAAHDAVDAAAKAERGHRPGKRTLDPHQSRLRPRGRNTSRASSTVAALMRVGANAGPLSVSGRPFNSPTLAGIGTFATAWVVLHAALDFRYMSVALAAAVGLAAYVGARIRRTRHARARDRQQQRARSWLAAPALPLTMPSRFTQAWLLENVPDLHPGQIDPLVQELTARGWKPEQIVHRLGPLLARHSATRARLRPHQVPSREASRTSGATPADTPPSNGNPKRTADPAPPARALSLALPAAASATVRVGSADDGVNRQALSLREVARES